MKTIERLVRWKALIRWSGINPDFPGEDRATTEGLRRGLAHELKYDGYRIHARLDRGSVRLLTRTGLDWTDRYGATARALLKREHS